MFPVKLPGCISIIHGVMMGPLLGPTAWFRWQHPTALPKTKMNHQSKDATDHCSTPFLHQLRTGPSDFYLRGTSFFAWFGLVLFVL